MADPLPLPGGGALVMEGGTGIPSPRGPTPAPAPARPALAMALPPAPPRRTGFVALHLSLGGVALAVPAALARRIHPFAPPAPLPGAPPGVLGVVLLDGAPAPVLALPDAPGAEGAAHLLELRHAGRRFALPAARISAGPTGGGFAQAWLDGPEGTALLALAPRAVDAPPPASRAERPLVLFSAGGQDAALPAESVVAVLPPQAPLRVPGGFVAGHRGAVLPVLDAGPRLGGAPTPFPAPLLRLATRPEVLVAVSAVAGVRAVAEGELHPLPAGALVAALARRGDAALPVLSAAVLGRAA